MKKVFFFLLIAALCSSSVNAAGGGIKHKIPTANHVKKAKPTKAEYVPSTGISKSGAYTGQYYVGLKDILRSKNGPSNSPGAEAVLKSPNNQTLWILEVKKENLSKFKRYTDWYMFSCPCIAGPSCVATCCQCWEGYDMQITWPITTTVFVPVQQVSNSQCSTSPSSCCWSGCFPIPGVTRQANPDQK